MRPKKSKMRKLLTKGLKKCFQLIWFVCLIGLLVWLVGMKANWKSKEPSERINKLEQPKQVTLKRQIANYTESLPHITSYHCIHLLNKLETKFLE